MREIERKRGRKRERESKIQREEETGMKKEGVNSYHGSHLSYEKRLVV
jgi:hypothetical protein